MATLTVRGLARRFDEVVALRDVSLTVADGRVAALLGPSGCGKTTVLRLIAGLDSPDAGDVMIDGESVLDRPPHRRGVGLMFQELALFPHLDVSQNIEFGLRMSKWSKPARAARISELLELVDLPGLGGRRIHELSSGQRQRVALARTLAPEPAVLLLDEPLGALDESLKQELRAQLRQVLARLRTTALIVSHDLRDAAAVADDIVVMGGGDVLQAGPIPAVLAGPSSVAVALMLGYVTIADGAVENGRVVEAGVGAVPIPEELPPGRRAQVLAHPSSLLAVPPGSDLGCGVEGTVVASRPDGPTQVLDIALGDERVMQARWEWDLPPPEDGATVDLTARPGTLRFFRVLDEWEPVEHGELQPPSEPPTREAPRGEAADGEAPVEERPAVAAAAREDGGDGGEDDEDEKGERDVGKPEA